MELKEARELAELIRQQSVLSKGLRAYTAIVTLDDRITELEAEMKQILNEFDEVEGQRNILFGLCEDALEKCPFPVGASLLREKLQIAVEQTEDAILNTQEEKEIKQPSVAG